MTILTIKTDMIIVTILAIESNMVENIVGASIINSQLKGSIQISV